ncbi:MAG TPA: energy transducer TonB [Pyrinomonadaceae bacterium]|nr:energy transducer TonB [Pyrinomonadaceae bacterium]
MRLRSSVIKHSAYFVAAILLSAVVIQAQQDDAPFAMMDRLAKDKPLVWAGDKQSLSKMFDDERKRLGDQFESELLKWIADDPDKHYWVSAFIECEDYLHGNKRLPQLSLLIKQQGLALVYGKKDVQSRGYVVGLSITAAVLSEELGLGPLADFYKSQAEMLRARDSEMGGYVPALSKEEWDRYDGIKPADRKLVTVIGAAPPAVEGGNPPPHAPITGGILNGKAVKLAKPSYPLAAREARVSGLVQVRVIIDETGKVIYAQAVSGHPDLRKVCEEAAMNSEFSPTKLQGRPVKVSGFIQYNFVAR